MTDAYVYSFKAVSEFGPADQQSDALTTRTHDAHSVLSRYTWQINSKIVQIIRIYLNEYV